MLRGQVRGDVFVPGDDGYDAGRAGFQLFRPHLPEVLVAAEDTADVVAAVRFAESHGLAVAVRGMGHGQPDGATGGLLITTSRMSGVVVNATAGTAWISAGTSWAQVIEAAAVHGLVPLAGSAPHVGAIPYTLGGGLSLFARRHGYAADHVRALDVVLPCGEQRHVTARSEPELFWASRGAGGNFGVVTGMEIGLVRASTLYGGGLYFDAPLIGEVLRTWRRWTETVPEDMTSSVALIPFPDVPGPPEPLRGRHIAHVRIAHLGAGGEELVAPLRAVGDRLIDSLGELPCREMASICNDPTGAMPYRGTSGLLGDLEDGAVEALLDHVGPGSADPCVLELRHLGGALSRPPATANAVGGRDARFLFGITSGLSSAEPPEAELDASRAREHRVREAMSPWTTGRCLNFLGGDDSTVESVRASYAPDDYRRLRELKALHDPANMFRHGRPIPPAT